MFGLHDHSSVGIYHTTDVPPPPFFIEIDSEDIERQAEMGL